MPGLRFVETARVFESIHLINPQLPPEEMTEENKHKLNKIRNVLQDNPLFFAAVLEATIQDRNSARYSWISAKPEFRDDLVTPGQYLDQVVPDLFSGSYIAPEDKPTAEVASYLRYFTRAESEDLADRRLRHITRMAVQKFFQNIDPFWGQEAVKTLNHLEEIMRGEERRTKEPAVRHLDRGLLRLLSSFYLIQQHTGSSWPCILFVDEDWYYGESKAITIETLFTAPPKTKLFRPLDDFFLPLTYATIVAYIMHDLPEDYGVAKKGDKGYGLEVQDKDLVIWQGKKEKEVFRVTFPEKRFADYASILIESVTKKEYPKELVTDGETAMSQIEKMAEILHPNDTRHKDPYLYWLFTVGSLLKWSDRKDNTATYWDIPDEEVSQAELTERRLYKLQEVFDYFCSVMDYSNWMTMNYDLLFTPTASKVSFPPQLSGEVVLRLLGATLNELYQPAIAKARQKAQELNLREDEYLVVADPFLPIIVKENGEFIHIIRDGS